MPEYLYPGVYVVEVAAGAKPIDGVSTSTADLIGSDCIGKLHRLATVPAPEWTDYNEHDPGVTVLELLAWLTESLVYRTERLSDDGVVHASRLAAAALALANNCEQPARQCAKAHELLFGPAHERRGFSRRAGLPAAATHIAIASTTSGGGANADGDGGDTAPVSRQLPAVPRTRIPTRSRSHNRSRAPARRRNPTKLQPRQRQVKPESIDA